MMHFFPLTMILAVVMAKSFCDGCNAAYEFDKYMKDFNQLNALWKISPEAEPFLDSVLNYFQLIRYNGAPLDKAAFEYYLNHASIEYEIEKTAITTTDVLNDTVIGTYKERMTFGDGVVIQTHECTTAIFDMEKCVPKTWDQILDPAIEASVNAKLKENQQKGIVVDRSIKNEL